MKICFKVSDGVTSSKLMITAMAASSFPSLEAEEVPGEFLLAFAAPWENKMLPKVGKNNKMYVLFISPEGSALREKLRPPRPLFHPARCVRWWPG